MDESEIRKWQQSTYKELLDDLLAKGVINKILHQEVAGHFEQLELTDKRVDGYSVQGLPKTDETKAGKISYTEIFHSIKVEEFTPVLYLVRLVQAFKNKNPDENDLSGFLARGLRTLSSLLREPVFAEKLERHLKNSDPKVKTSTCPIQDAADHTDILLEFKGKIFRIWLFQFSDRGLPHDIERVTGQRGELPNGIHVLCPLKTELARSHDQKIKSLNTSSLMVKKLKEKLSLTSVNAVKARENISNRISELEIKIGTLGNDLRQLEKDIDFEIEVIAGWYLYSDKYIMRLCNSFTASTTYEPYNAVKAILMKPKEYLSEIHFFEKGQ